MIHSGAVVGAGLPQVRDDELGVYVPQGRLPGWGLSMVEFGKIHREHPNVALESAVSLG